MSRNSQNPLRDYSPIRKVFTRCIAIKQRICSQCEDVAAEEGEIFYKDKRLQVWCPTCKDYDDDKAHLDYGDFGNVRGTGL